MSISYLYTHTVYSHRVIYNEISIVACKRYIYIYIYYKCVYVCVCVCVCDPGPQNLCGFSIAKNFIWTILKVIFFI